MSGRWREQHSIRFVTLYKNQESLWHVFNPAYKNREVRRASLQYIVEHMQLPGFTEKDVLRKIKNFRSTYNQELLKIAKSKSTATDVNDIYKPNIKWFNIMHYIMKNRTKKFPARGTELCSTVKTENKTNISQEIFLNDLKDNETCNNNTFNTVNESSEPITNNKNGSDSRELNEKCYRLPMEDECDVIGRHIAIQLRQLPIADMIQANAEIQQILTNYRLNNIYGRAAYAASTVFSSPSPPNPPSPEHSILPNSPDVMFDTK